MSLLGTPVPAERPTALARVGAIVDEPRFHPPEASLEDWFLSVTSRLGES